MTSTAAKSQSISASLQPSGVDHLSEVVETQGEVEIGEDGEEIVHDDGFNLKENRWAALKNKTQDHLVKELVRQSASLGAFVQEGRLFMRSPTACDALAKLKKILVQRDDPIMRVLRIKIHELKLFSRLIPLFAGSFQDEMLISACIKYCREVTRDFDPNVKKAFKDTITFTRKGNGTNRESKEELADRNAVLMAARDNAMKQVSAALYSKEAMCNKDILFNMVAHCMDFVKKEDKSAKDLEIILTVLELFRNLLRIGASSLSDAAEKARATSIHNKLIILLQGPFYTMMLDLCANLYKPVYTNAHRAVVCEILFHLYRDREAMDLYRVSKMEHSRETNEQVTAALGRTPQRDSMCNAGHKEADGWKQNQATSIDTSGSSLLSQVRNRHDKMAAISRQPRFGGVFRLKSELLQKQNGENEPNNQLHALNPILTDPFSASEKNRLPSANAKAFKRQVTFVTDDVKDARKGGDILDTAALQVLVDFMKSIAADGIQGIVHFTGQQFRNETISETQELQYYRVMTLVIQFRRVELLESQRVNDSATSGSDSAPWQLPKRTVGLLMLHLDRLHFNNVINRIKKYTDEKQPVQVLVPMELYKEMICLMQLLLMSKSRDHPLLMLATLKRLYYLSGNDK
jgi:hypothetical protein